MNKLNKDRLVFLEETIAFYSEDTSRRAVREDGMCMYKTSDGRSCAIGRHISPTKYRKDLEEISFSISLFRGVLPNEYISLGNLFLGEIQYFHDEECFWSYSGLTEAGIFELNRMKLAIKNGGYD